MTDQQQLITSALELIQALAGEQEDTEELDRGLGLPGIGEKILRLKRLAVKRREDCPAQLETARKALADIQEYIDTSEGGLSISNIYRLAQIGAGEKGQK
jgi:hypothetical protein